MKITITLNGVEVKKNIPLSWSEVNFEQFVKLSKVGNDFASILSVFVDIDPETLKKATIYNLESVRELISFVESKPLADTIPDSILGYKMPKNLEVETIGQYEDLKMEAAEIKEAGIEKYAVIAAIYAVNPYSHEEAEKLALEFFNAPCEEVVAIGNFTLMKLIESRRLGLKSTLRATSRMTKWKLAIKGYLIRLVFTVRYYLWKRKLRSTVKSF